jgi:dGTPase
MDWEKLLSKRRLSKTLISDESDFRSEFHKDYDRIVFSSAFRRLGRKTQVHPLSNNDHIHTRLTHSIEVGSVGRSIGHNVGAFLEEKAELPKGIYAQEIGAIVQAACLAHDIGNPPFGHAGEFAIRHWFKENGKKLVLESKS